VLGPAYEFQRLPVRHTTTGATVNGTQSSAAPNVLSSGLWVPFDLDRAKLKIDPRSTDSPTQRAVAIGGHLRCRRQDQSNRSALA
jgi:hypothetical protein